MECTIAKIILWPVPLLEEVRTLALLTWTREKRKYLRSTHPAIPREELHLTRATTFWMGLFKDLKPWDFLTKTASFKVSISLPLITAKRTTQMVQEVSKATTEWAICRTCVMLTYSLSAHSLQSSSWVEASTQIVNMNTLSMEIMVPNSNKLTHHYLKETSNNHLTLVETDQMEGKTLLAPQALAKTLATFLSVHPTVNWLPTRARNVWRSTSSSRSSRLIIS